MITHKYLYLLVYWITCHLFIDQTHATQFYYPTVMLVHNNIFIQVTCRLIRVTGQTINRHIICCIRAGYSLLSGLIGLDRRWGIREEVNPRSRGPQRVARPSHMMLKLTLLNNVLLRKTRHSLLLFYLTNVPVSRGVSAPFIVRSVCNPLADRSAYNFMSLYARFCSQTMSFRCKESNIAITNYTKVTWLRNWKEIFFV